MKTKNIIFDLGGVFLPLNMQATLDAFKKLGAKNFESIYTFKSQEKFFDHFDKGLITPDDFRMELKKNLRDETTFGQIDLAWNAMLNIIPQAQIDFIKSVQNRFNIFLLSNTNAIHVAKFEADHLQYYGYNLFHSLFTRAYYSNNLGMRKPDLEIFEFVLLENNLKPEETVFFDDSPQHIEGALNAGISAYHLNLEKENIMTLFHRTLETRFP
jgi:putative hydrolase of the HAD superfamily